jgi:hypothetical protein
MPKQRPKINWSGITIKLYHFMKKLIPALLLFVITMFAMSGAKATSVSSKNVAAATTTVASGHWEYWCIYNEKTGEFEIMAVWVEDDMES